jgi:hypothetical protein
MGVGEIEEVEGGGAEGEGYMMIKMKEKKIC